jgi:hypothetical protein
LQPRLSFDLTNSQFCKYKKSGLPYGRGGSLRKSTYLALRTRTRALGQALGQRGVAGILRIVGIRVGKVRKTVSRRRSARSIKAGQETDICR